MILACLAGALVGVVSAFLPLVPIEPYVLGAAALDRETAVPVALCAGVGQTIGKVLIFLVARGSLHSRWLHQWIEKRRRVTPPDRRVGRLLGWVKAPTALAKRPLLAVPTLLLSAVVGIPPLLIATFYLAAAEMRLAVFAVTCLVGRCTRLVLLALIPGLAAHLM